FAYYPIWGISARLFYLLGGKMSSEDQQEVKDLEYYCRCIREIKVYTNTKLGVKCRNQPTLLLSVIHLIANGTIAENKILITEDLINVFKKYWSVSSDTSFKNSDFALPFFHLKNGQKKGKYKFWHLQYSSEYDGGRPQTIPKLRHDVDYAYLDEEMFQLIINHDYRQKMVDQLITFWFTKEQEILESIFESYRP
ncbi:MAG: hypothetical protein P5679_24770, partial [Limnospira sp. PMC 1249.20]|nr:hypothetical protein [Limnospira sp. PMC 1249.20]